MKFNGQVVLVTGGTQGIGRGIADAFLDAGATVIVCARRPPQAPGRAEFCTADVRNLDQIGIMVASIVARHARLDVLVNNAGGSPPVDAATVSPRFSAAIIDLNLTAPLNLSQIANQTMQRQPGGGCIINVCSVSGVRPSPGTAAYGAAKAGLLSLTRSLGVEWAPNVRVNAIVAGLIATEKAPMHYGDDAAQARVAQTVPLGRLGTPSDVASAALFLASDQASYITGAALEVHGGGEIPAFLGAATDAE